MLLRPNTYRVYKHLNRVYEAVFKFGEAGLKAVRYNVDSTLTQSVRGKSVIFGIQTESILVCPPATHNTLLFHSTHY